MPELVRSFYRMGARDRKPGQIYRASLQTTAECGVIRNLSATGMVSSGRQALMEDAGAYLVVRRARRQPMFV
jgi:hypothetical protein